MLPVVLRYHAIAQEEVSRTVHKLPNITEADRQQLEELARRVVNKLLHDPVTTLKESDGTHGPAAPYLHALTKLFHLPEDTEGL